MDSGTLAAWVQAIGSILAIPASVGGALAVLHTQRRAESLGLRSRVAREAKMVRDAVRSAALYAGIDREVVNTYEIQKDGLELDLQSIIQHAENLPLEKLESPIALETMQRLLGAAKSFLKHQTSTAGPLVNGFLPREAAYQLVVARYRELDWHLHPGTAERPPGF